MQFLSVSRRRTEAFADEQFAAMVADEVQQARTLYAEGLIRQIWHRADVAGACILLEADTLESARSVLNRLPMVASGMLEVTVIPLKPYAGFCPR
jgi:muconolactone delta-isomerase